MDLSGIHGRNQSRTNWEKTGDRLNPGSRIKGEIVLRVNFYSGKKEYGDVADKVHKLRE